MPKKKNGNTPLLPLPTIDNIPNHPLLPALIKMDTYKQESAEWKAANARAKEIIMASLVPGSEAWKIAEPLELASDIWKAIEQRYAPQSETYRQATEQAERQQQQQGLVPVSWQAAVSAQSPLPTPSSTSGSPDQGSSSKSGTLTKVKSKNSTGGNTMIWQEDVTELDEETRQKRKEAQAAAAKILVEHMPNRDQRFLWAVLHGGKEETMAWFYGTANSNNNVAGRVPEGTKAVANG